MISIVVASYNRKDALARCIRSILAQTYTDLELIIIDDDSKDDTQSVVKSFADTRIRYIRNERNMGPAFSRNKGLGCVTGDFFMVWDSDDFLYPHALSSLLVGFDTYPDACTISAPTRVKKGKEEVVYTPIAAGLFPFPIIVCGDYVKYKLIRLSRAKQMNAVRYVGRNLDFMFNTALAELGPWYQLSEYLGEHFLESDTVSLTTSRRKSNALYSIERSWPLHNYLQKYKEIFISRCPSRYAAHSYGAALGFLLSGDIDRGRLYAREAYMYGATYKYLFTLILSYTPAASLVLKFLFMTKRFLYSVFF